MYDANMSKEKAQKITNVIIAYSYCHREIKKTKMDKKLAFFDFISEPPNSKMNI